MPLTGIYFLTKETLLGRHIDLTYFCYVIYFLTIFFSNVTTVAVIGLLESVRSVKSFPPVTSALSVQLLVCYYINISILLQGVNLDLLVSDLYSCNNSM